MLTRLFSLFGRDFPTEFASSPPQGVHERINYLMEGVVVLNEQDRLSIANFRFGLIAPLVTRQLEKGERQKILMELVTQTYLTPLGECKKVSLRTLERYVKAYLKEGLEGLLPKQRQDTKASRAIPSDILDKAIALKLESPSRSIHQIIRILELTDTVKEGYLKPSTLSAHLLKAQEVKKQSSGNSKTFRRYEMTYRNQVWQADTHHTLYLPHPTLENKRRLAYLIVFLDDYSRMITHGEFFFEENVLNLEQVFKKAILKYGVPEKLYVDNGAIYSSNHLQTICTRLNTHLIHAQPYRPQGKGKVERFFHYVDRSFKPEAYLLIEQGKLTTLESLNQYFAAWLDKAYLNRVHGTTKEKPRLRFLDSQKDLRYVDPVLIDKHFLWQEDRTVDSTGCVNLEGNIYEVDLVLVKEKVTLKYDPSDLSRLEVWFNGEQYADALPLNLSRERHKKLPPLPQEPVPSTGLNFLEATKSAVAKERAEGLCHSLSFSNFMKEASHND